MQAPACPPFGRVQKSASISVEPALLGVDRNQTSRRHLVFRREWIRADELHAAAIRTLRGAVQHVANAADDDRRCSSTAEPSQTATHVLPFAVRKGTAQPLNRRQLQLAVDRLEETFVALRKIDDEVEIGGRYECAQVRQRGLARAGLPPRDRLAWMSGRFGYTVCDNSVTASPPGRRSAARGTPAADRVPRPGTSGSARGVRGSARRRGR